jgi:acetate---CoA ligase (ADP-forming)
MACLGDCLPGSAARPRGDVPAAVDAVMAVAAFAERRRNSLLELDVNPLLVPPDGKGAVAVDALLRLAER